MKHITLHKMGYEINAPTSQAVQLMADGWDLKPKMEAKSLQMVHKGERKHVPEFMVKSHIDKGWDVV